jgi:non-ribosomal peptide synthetase component F
MERGGASIVGLMDIVKAGVAYVPLDSDLPVEGGAATRRQTPIDVRASVDIALRRITEQLVQRRRERLIRRPFATRVAQRGAGH